MSNLKKKKKNKNQKKLRSLYLLALLLAISNALPVYIQSNFLKEFMNIKTVSFFFMIANILTVVSILAFPKLIEKLSNFSLTKIVSGFYLLALLGLAFSNGGLMAVLSIIIFTITSNLIWINMDVAVESLSSNNLTGKIRTTYFTLMNFGYFLSPVLATYLIGKGGYTLAFLVAASLVIPFFLLFVHNGRNVKKQIKYQKESIIVSLKKMWKNKNLRSIFFIALLLQLFYSSAVIYIPLHLVQDLSMSWKVLGPIFSIMLIPFILIEIPAGIMADKYWGEKEMMFVGFLILIISLFSFYYISVPIAWVWLIVLFLSRVGAALVESMKETYFFKLVDVEELDYINIFRITTPLAYVFGTGLAILILNFLPLKFLFLFLAIIMISGLGFTLSIKDTK